MPIIYDKLFKLLKEKQISVYMIKRTGLISQESLYKMKNRHGHISTKTIEKICCALEVQPGDIMEYVENEEENSSNNG